ncbi:MAG: hypothetical protein DMG54_07160 [Acidobacteria bacterium]|nr:MAG: hypothetical protein DMG53_18460 [Acidobacteriota bacterium]PYU45114.1 MAG: hypothetical protein DMG54_07160 [Acidobacteriota bacterium]PYU74188.1 MAG: hypothetical protein DMG52_11945 [Acidobacteriota bacterium]
MNQILEALEKTYGPQQATGPTDPYEMIVYLNCGYPASDRWCSKGFDVLKREVGLSPRELLAAPGQNWRSCCGSAESSRISERRDGRKSPAE